MRVLQAGMGVAFRPLACNTWASRRQQDKDAASCHVGQGACNMLGLRGRCSKRGAVALHAVVASSEATVQRQSVQQGRAMQWQVLVWDGCIKGKRLGTRGRSTTLRLLPTKSGTCCCCMLGDGQEGCYSAAPAGHMHATDLVVLHCALPCNARGLQKQDGDVVDLLHQLHMHRTMWMPCGNTYVTCKAYRLCAAQHLLQVCYLTTATRHRMQCCVENCTTHSCRQHKQPFLLPATQHRK